MKEKQIKIQVEGRYKEEIESYCAGHGIEVQFHKVYTEEGSMGDFYLMVCADTHFQEIESYCEARSIKMRVVKRGRPTDKQRDKRINFRLDNDKYKLIKDYCADRNITITDLIDSRLFDNSSLTHHTQSQDAVQEILRDMEKNVENWSKTLKELNKTSESSPSLEMIQTPPNRSNDNTSLGSHHNKTNKLIYYRVLAVASAFVFLFIGYMYWQSDLPTEVDANYITLRHSDGSIQRITENAEKNITNKQDHVLGVQKANRLDYTQNNVNTLIYNELLVPYGKRFQVVLSDGTHVYLNAGSTLKYPVRFIEGEKREVTLNGEGYFEVIKKGENSKFIVHAGDMDVEVLGTSFNLSRYDEDEEVRTVLVEGLVQLHYSAETGDQRQVKMIPNQRAVFNKKDGSLDVKSVNVEAYTSWRKGELLFKKSTFGRIRRKLERHFDLSIVNRVPRLDEKVFTASFFENESVEEVLLYLSEIHSFNYKKEKNQIIVY